MSRTKTWLAWAGAISLVAYLTGAATSGQSTVNGNPAVIAFATGTGLHVDALQAGLEGPRVADAEVAFSAANVNAQGFGANSGVNENSVLLQPNPADEDPAVPFVGKNASARGAGLELGVGSDVPTQAGEVLAMTRSNAVAPPDSSNTDDLGPLPVGPAAYVSALHSDASGLWDMPTCLTTADEPIAYGRGYAADVMLLDAGTPDEDGVLQNPVVATDDPNPTRNVIQTESFIYAVPNGNGNKYGLVSEVHQTYAPITVLRSTPAPALIIEVLGEWFVKTTADGVNPATMEYGVTDPDTGNPVAPGATVIRLSVDGGLTYSGFSFQDVQEGGIVLPTNPLLELAIGEDLRAISAPGAIPNVDSAPTLLANGTRASGAVDVVRLSVLKGITDGVSAADLRIGHFESSLQVPAGGFSCPPPPTTTTTTGSTTTTTRPATTTTAVPLSTTTTAAPGTTTTTARPLASTTTTSTPPTTRPPTPVTVQPRFVG